MKKPVFILGVGAQKAGTSWLHAQLQKQPAVNMGFRKEYHVWDNMLFEAAERAAVLPEVKKDNRGLRELMRSHDGAYEDYFIQLINDEVHFTGDITPSYAMLSTDIFGGIKKRLENVGFSVKVIFIMRDPVERVWSYLRMRQRRMKQSGTVIVDADLAAVFASVYRSQGVIARTRYDETIRSLRQVFAEDDLCFSFYESLFNEDSTKSISKFLNLELKQIDTSEKINASKTIALSQDLRDRCKEFYSDVYSFCEAEFPEVKMLWK